jgi:hypothetical protein
VLLLGDLLLLVLFERLHGISLEILRSERLLQFLLPSLILFGLDQELAGVLTDPHHCGAVHGVRILNGDYVVELVDLLLDLPPRALLGPQLLAD